MKRHKKRETNVLQSESRLVTREDVAEMPLVCAWEGCGADFQGEQPSGWRNLLVFWAPVPILDITKIPPGTWDRDAVLCPAHVHELDGLLKDIGVRLKGPVAGEA